MFHSPRGSVKDMQSAYESCDGPVSTDSNNSGNSWTCHVNRSLNFNSCKNGKN
jgi:hypothetical protein